MCNATVLKGLISIITSVGASVSNWYSSGHYSLTTEMSAWLCTERLKSIKRTLHDSCLCICIMYSNTYLVGVCIFPLEDSLICIWIINLHIFLLQSTFHLVVLNSLQEVHIPLQSWQILWAAVMMAVILPTLEHPVLYCNSRSGSRSNIHTLASSTKKIHACDGLY